MSFMRPRDLFFIEDSPEPQPYNPVHLQLQSNPNGSGNQQSGGVGDHIDRIDINGPQSQVSNEFSFGNFLFAGRPGTSQPSSMTFTASTPVSGSNSQTVASAAVPLPQYSGATSRSGATSNVPAIQLPTPMSENDWRFGLPLYAPPRSLEGTATPIPHYVPTPSFHAAQPSTNEHGQAPSISQWTAINKERPHDNLPSTITPAISHGEVNPASGTFKACDEKAVVENHIPLDLKKNVPQRPSTLATASKTPQNIANNAELPFMVIHLLVNTIQKLLEQILFEFAKRWVPKLLELTRWEVPEQGELNTWVRYLDGHRGDVNFGFRANGVSVNYYDFRAMLERLHHLRHAAVHRNPITTIWLRRWMVDAVDMTDCLAKCLQDSRCFNKFRVIEFGVWQPHNVKLEEIAGKPLSEFTSDYGVPHRSSFVDAATAADVRKGKVRPPPRADTQPQGMIQLPRRPASPPTPPRHRRKRARSVTPARSLSADQKSPRRSKRRKESKATKTTTYIDLTGDLEEGEVEPNGKREIGEKYREKKQGVKKKEDGAGSSDGTFNNAVTKNVAVIIDLTED